MTSTAEERAEGVCAALARAEAAFDGRGWVEMPKADRNRYVARAMLAKPLIAQALRSAENEKLEEAAACAAGAVLRAIDDGSPRAQVSIAAAFAIRSLKSKDTP